jgi:hypothetical protein
VGEAYPPLCSTHRQSGEGKFAIARIVIAGAWVVGLGAALLLCRDSHQVTVWSGMPRRHPVALRRFWDSWQRKSVNQSLQGFGSPPMGSQLSRPR